MDGTVKSSGGGVLGAGGMQVLVQCPVPFPPPDFPSPEYPTRSIIPVKYPVCTVGSTPDACVPLCFPGGCPLHRFPILEHRLIL